MSEMILMTAGEKPSKRLSGRLVDKVSKKLVWLSTLLALFALMWLLPLRLSLGLGAFFAVLAWMARANQPSPAIRFFSFLGMAAYVVVLGGFGWQSETGTGLLIAAMIIKQIEMRFVRDAAILLLFDLVATFTAMLQSQGPILLLISLSALFLSSAASLSLTESATGTIRQHLLRSGGFLLLVAPLAVVLYLLVPRLDAPLWVGRTSTTSGVSDHMDVSDWTNLINDYSTAFRVHFQGKAPPASSLYYRGYVLLDFDGRSWTVGKPLSATTPVVGDQGKVWANYRVYYEDKNLQRFFLLDYPTQIPAGGKILATGEAVPNARKFSPSLSAQAGIPEKEVLVAADRLRYLEIPNDSSPRVRAMVKSWRANGDNDQQVIARAMQMFSRGYQYTLNPPKVDRSQPVDSFVFDIKRGFCMHYSSALAVMLRVAGIPTRIVTGYASAEMSELGDYYRVRQADAHAWVEAWNGDRWMRLDPTSRVSAVRQPNAGSWSATFRNGGYEMGEWFKSYWDRWVSFYDAGAQEKTIEAAKSSIYSFAEKAQKDRGGLALMAFALLFSGWAGVLMFRWFVPPSLALSRSKMWDWLDTNAPSQMIGESWRSRLSRLTLLDKSLSDRAEVLFSTLDVKLFDPAQTAIEKKELRLFKRSVQDFLMDFARMKQSQKIKDVDQDE